MSIIGFGMATEETVRNFEQHIGFSLPDDYKQFLIEYNGGTPQVRYSTFTVEALSEIIPLDVLYGLGIDSEMDLQDWNDEYRSDLLSNSIIIGRDPGTGMVVLINDAEIKGVFYWDHSLFFNQSNEEENVYKICDSFQEFINQLKKP
ncbi:SMI1/KNR4 family protein [Ruminiclostridium cellobioparum]|jgi:hypothetical protein|uniref:SMI1 / KNR4 family n=1 Tax=Ruminiclostridium cellobioparum subsp. termitidis CT1112 TaxID=1195236 RepID=S0FGG9_RUMCE|nr:SMI1/KNR4 family protein [Ruminiclostridium cellobioparum]EMS70127.1 SMI1 / KNR4 family [Ruminiclostridium cellobioparum subsp. termitidis CT1112]